MSNSFQAQDSQVQANQLAVQELVIKQGDPLIAVSGADILVDVREPVAEIVLVLFKDDSAATIAPKAQASLSIEDSATQTDSVIKIASLTLAANDVIVIRYKTV